MVTSRRIFPALCLAAAALLTGCEIGSTVIPRTDPAIVVHSILNPSSRVQVILVEQSLTGAVDVVDEGPYDPGNPIGTGQGVPVAGAIVTLTGENGLAMTAVEYRPDGKTTGIYRVLLDAYSTPGNSVSIRRGERYDLRVITGPHTVTGSTLVPMATPPFGTLRLTFNRDEQAVSLPISDVSLARAYWLRIDAPVRPYSLFTLDQELAIAGSARNIFTDDLVRVFQPGFLQTLTVAAVDTNVYDYYRSGSDPFSGQGLINHLEGGLGLFGSMVVMEQRLLDVTQNNTGDPIEDRFTLRTGPPEASTHAFSIRLFVESFGAEGQADRITGSHLRGIVSSPVRGAVYGTREGASLRLQLLTANSTSSYHSTFRGTLRGDSLIGVYESSPDNAVYVRFGK